MNFFGLPEFVSYAIIVGIAVELMRQDKGAHLKYWLAGWIIILLHAGVFMLLIPGLVEDVLGRGLLALAGLAFLLAAYYQKSELEIPGLLRVLGRIGLPNLVFAVVSTAYTELRPNGHDEGAFAALIAVGSACSIWQALSNGETRRQSLALVALTCIVYGVQAWFLYGFGVLMASQWLMCWTYLAVAFFFLRQTRSLTMGVAFTALSFMFWGLVFPVYSLLMIYAPAVSDHIEGGVWNLPKFLTAASMILVLLEEKIRRATRLATRLVLAQRIGRTGSAEFDPKTGEIAYSEEFFRILGWDANAALKGTSPDLSVFHPEDREKAGDAIARMRAGEAVPSVELRVVRPDGAVAWARRDQEVIYGSDGRPERVIVSFLDITDQKRHEQEKDEFLSMINHELRTPLTSIRGALSMIAANVAGPIPDKAARLVEIASRNGERLSRLIDDLLDMQRIQEGRMVYNLADTDLSQVVTDSIETIRPFAVRYGVEVRLGTEIPAAYVHVDAQRISQVLANLLSNAIKFTRGDAEKVVEISVERRSPSIRITVQDHGVGIPEAFRGQMFKRFSQSDIANSREHGGSGLGLNIVAAIVAHHRGQISFDSELGVGTKFYLDLKEVEVGGARELNSNSDAVTVP